MKIFFSKLLFLALMFSYACSGHLLDDYKRRIGSDVTALNSGTKQTAVHSYAMADEIKTFNAMRKKTFESSREFIKRVNKEISSRYNEIDFYIKSASKNYSVGRVEMKRYNPDSEIMTLNLIWDKKIKDILRQSNNFKTVSIPIAREEAKKLFSKKEKPFFHIQLAYTENKLSISEIQLYNKYVLYRDMNKKRTPILENRSTTKYHSEKEKQNTGKKTEILYDNPSINNKTNNQSEVLEIGTKDNKDLDYNKEFLIISIFIILILLISIVSFFRYKSNSSKVNLDKKSISSTGNPNSKKNTSVKTSYSKKLHDIAQKYELNLVYEKIQISENEVTVKILQNKKVIARETAKTYKEAKQMAACVVLDKIKWVRKQKS